MTEAFLHYVWQFQYFDKSDLLTTSGEAVSIFHVGFQNIHSGPDFFNSKIKIGEMEWAGTTEIHINSSGWNDHKHDSDEAYENVILHVVWKEDKKIKRKDGSELPTIELHQRVKDTFLLQYRKLVNHPDKIPCASFFDNVPSLTKFTMIDKSLIRRLESKAMNTQSLLERNKNDWDETFYQMICRNFGFKVNSDPFEQLSHALPYKILLKHADNTVQVEALLFGQAGFLEELGRDEYFLLLKREYAVLSQKYNLKPNQLKPAQWRFLRLRPANFPTLRIAQLTGLLCSKKNMFSRILEASAYGELVELFSAGTSAYWQHHYQFFKFNIQKIPSFGKMSIDNFIINTVVPLLAAYSKTKDEQRYMDRAVDILNHIGPEDNSILKTWAQVGMQNRSAADSQGLIELYNNFCLKRRCLDCNIGFSIIKPSAA
jgi:hypothetical protein